MSRTRQFNARLRKPEREKMAKLSVRLRISMANVVRMAVFRLYDEYEAGRIKAEDVELITRGD